MSNILVVDDEAGIRELLREILHDEGHQVRLAENAGEARAIRERERPDLVLLDIWMPDTDGITLLKEWASNGLLTMPVIMMSGHGTIDTAVETTKIGAYDFLEKPITLQKLLHTVERALRRSEAMAKPRSGLSRLGKSPLIAALAQRLEHAAALKVPLLLAGESGAGAELCARFLHLPNTPWHAPGSTDGLAQSPLDLLQEAREGVLFLQEVGELDKLEQKGLLLLLSRLEKFSVQLVCATTKPLPRMVAEGAFDEGLFQALSVATVTIPGLHEHREDIPELAKMALERLIEEKAALPQRHFSAAALNMLRNAEWPGNLHQLDDTVKSLALTSLNEEISPEDVSRVLSQFAAMTPAATHALSLDIPLREARDAFERLYFEHHISKAAGNMSRVAENVGLERTHLYRKLKQLEIKASKK